MKRERYLTAIVMALLLAGLAGCTGEGGENSSNDVMGGGDLSALDTNDFAVADADDAFTSIEGPTLDQKMVMDEVLLDGVFRRRHDHPHHRGSHIGTILRELMITPMQMWKIFEFVVEHRKNLHEAFRGIWTVNQPIIEAANEARMTILRALENGEITEEEARQQLMELGRRMRNAIRSNPDNEPFLRAICESTRELFRKIRSALLPEQQDLWDRWVESLSGRCFGG